MPLPLPGRSGGLTHAWRHSPFPAILWLVTVLALLAAAEAAWLLVLVALFGALDLLLRAAPAALVPALSIGRQA